MPFTVLTSAGAALLETGLDKGMGHNGQFVWGQIKPPPQRPVSAAGREKKGTFLNACSELEAMLEKIYHAYIHQACAEIVLDSYPLRPRGPLPIQAVPAEWKLPSVKGIHP